MDVSKSALPALYLDWDGVINFMGSRSQYRKRSGLSYMRRGHAAPLQSTLDNQGYSMFRYQSYPLNWSAELLRKLAALPVEVVILSTWRDSFGELIRATQWNELENYRVLDWTDGPKDREHAGKVPALVADQLADPRPFIWADDEAHKFYGEAERALLAGTPQLLLAPDENIGLTMDDYLAMVAFLGDLKSGAE